MIARAACAALALVAGSLASSPAMAQSLPADPPVVPAPPADPAPASAPPGYPAPPGYMAPPGYPAPPGYMAPPGYTAPPGYLLQPIYPPASLVFRDGAWQPVGEGTDGPARRPGRDPLLPTGITLAAASLVTTAIGLGWLASSGASTQVCGLSGCIAFSDPEAQNSAVAMIAGGVGAGLLSGAVAYFGARGPASPRRSNPRMVAGVAFTTLGVANAVAGVANAIAPYRLRGTRAGEVDPGLSGSTHTSGETVLFTLVSATCLGIGLPLWITGAWAPRSRRGDAASSLDLLPAPGGAAIRWTR